MKTMLLTGCTGWLGRSIVPYFAERYGVDVLTRQFCDVVSSVNVPTMGRFVMGDARDIELPRSYDYIVHGALDGARNIIDQAGDAKVLFLSSGAVYRQFTEYAEAKCRDEAILGDRAVIARLFSFIGPGMPEHYAAGEFLACLRDGKPIVIRGDGRTVRSYMHVRELPEVLEKLLECDAGTVADVGSLQAVTIRELAYLISTHVNTTNHDLPVFITQDKVDPVDVYVPRWVPFPRIGLAAAIEMSIA